MIHIIAVKERGPSAIDDPTHITIKSQKWWTELFKKHGFNASICPNKNFVSMFGSKGYIMFKKK